MYGTKSEHKKAIWLFISLTFVCSSVVWFFTINEGSGRIGARIYGFGIMWCPALATYLTCKLMKVDFRGLAWQWGETKWLFLAYIVPLTYILISYLIIWFSHWGGFYNQEFVRNAAKSLGWEKLSPGLFIVIFFIVNGLIQVIGGMATALGEEIGWRGFLVPRLMQITGYTGTSLISGFIWAAWHFPLLIFGEYNNGAPVVYSLVCFTVLVMSMAFIYTWFRIISKSLWPCVLLHASHNLFVQSFFTPITVSFNKSGYFIDEFGAVLPVVALCFAVYFWSKKKELTPAFY